MEKKDLRIVFMGTPEFAVGSLQRLVTVIFAPRLFNYPILPDQLRQNFLNRTHYAVTMR